MADRQTPEKSPKPADSREERLKAALKSNLARRKAQARAKAQAQAATAAGETNKNED